MRSACSICDNTTQWYSPHWLTVKIRKSCRILSIGYYQVTYWVLLLFPFTNYIYPHKCTDWYELCFTGMLQRLGPDRSSIYQIKKERWVILCLLLLDFLNWYHPQFELVTSAVLLSSTLCDKIRFLNNIHVVFLSQHCGVYCGIAFVYQRIVRCNWIQSLFYTWS